MIHNENLDYLLQISLKCVEQAMKIAKEIYANKKNLLIDNKKDNTPVTLADYCCQYLIMKELREKNPQILIIAEEDSSLLSEEMISAMRIKLGDPNLTRDQVHQVFHQETPLSDPEMFWALDPIDGTQGFLLEKGGQYCICLALLKKIENSSINYESVLGILGCPNLPESELVYAVKGGGVFINHTHYPQREIVEKKLSDALVTTPRVHHSKIPFKLEKIINMDSQCKYVIVLDGKVDLYFRPSIAFPSGYREKIWDHAAGVCIIREAGGQVYSVYDYEPIKFTFGKFLDCPGGIIACMDSNLGRSFAEEVKKIRPRNK
jgi:3'(2'), 5'-bisphosphate nucleotidase